MNSNRLRPVFLTLASLLASGCLADAADVASAEQAIYSGPPVTSVWYSSTDKTAVYTATAGRFPAGVIPTEAQLNAMKAEVTSKQAALVASQPVKDAVAALGRLGFGDLYLKAGHSTIATTVRIGTEANGARYLTVEARESWEAIN